MKAFRLLLPQVMALIAIASVCFAQDQDVPESATDEIKRRGYMVEEIDDNVRDDGTQAVAQAFGVPEDDSHKWFLTVIVADFQCPACDRLKLDLEKAPELSKWVKLDRRKDGAMFSTDDSFMHVNFEYAKNPFKPDRFSGVRITSYPTILIQTPLNGKWGKPGLVVNQRNGYSGKPAELDTWLKDSISQYARKFQEGHRSGGGTFRQEAPILAETQGTGQPFPVPSPSPNPLPWPGVPVLPSNPLPPDLVPVGPQPVAPPAPVAPDAPSPTLWAIIGALLGVMGTGGTIGLIFVVWGIYRALVKARGGTPLLTDEQFNKLRDEVLKQTQPRPAPAA